MSSACSLQEFSHWTDFTRKFPGLFQEGHLYLLSPHIAKPKTHILAFLFQQLVFRAYIFFNLKPPKRKLPVPVNGDKGDLSPGR